MDSGAFTKLYKNLNPAQKEAVDTIEGPVMVVAGPGTGKTQILTLRIANILRQTDTPPDGILALTFTESGVHSMRTRLLSIIGSGAYRVGIFTFHGFANDIIRRYPDAFDRIIGATQIDDVDRILLLRTLIDTTPLTRLKPFGDPYYHLGSIRAQISELKREHISPDKLRAIIGAQKAAYEAIDDLVHEKGKFKGEVKGKYRDLAKKIEKNEDLLALYERYEAALSEKRLFDYEDMIIEVIKALESDHDLLLSLQEQYLYLLADEHQDANNAQNRLLELLGSFHPSPNLFIVGDAKQAIYRFQGASLDNFLKFTRTYPDAKVIPLPTNYRSVQPILDAAHGLTLASSLPPDLRMPLTAHKGAASGTPEVRVFPRPEDERIHIARDIKRLIGEGVPPEEIAVLYRTNRDAAPLIETFEKHDVPFVVESDQNILQDPHVRKLLSLWRAAVNPGNDAALLTALHADFLGVAPSHLYRLVRAADRSGTRVATLLASPALLEEAGLGRSDALRAAFRMIEKYAKEVPFRNPFEIAEGLARDSGFVAAVLKSNESEDILEKVTSLFEALRERLERHRDATLADFMHYLSLIEEHDLLIKKDTRGERTGRVRCMTAHRAKGLEFDHVYIVGVVDGHYGNRRSLSNFYIPIIEGSDPLVAEDTGDDTEDERRLFYVALTRARTAAYISHTKENERGEAKLPSQFIAEMGSVATVYADPLHENIAEQFADRIRGRRTVVPPAEDKEYLNALFMEQGLSVTALNNYLASPWKYFYQNLLRIPKTPDRHLLYGDAMHDALWHAFEQMKEGGAFDRAFLLATFDESLKRKPLPTSAYTEALRRGEAALIAYIDARTPLTTPLRTEWKIETLFDVGEGIKIPLRGKLDKVERIDDGPRLRVIDYKTGRHKSRNEIEGKTKGSTGDLKRQLVFYRLLLEEAGGEYQFGEGVLDFIEPDEKGNIHTPDRFSITDEEVVALKDDIRRVAREIIDLAFWDTVCDPEECDYCDLVDALRKK